MYTGESLRLETVPDLLEELGDKELTLYGITGSMQDLADMCPIDLHDPNVTLEAKNDFVIKAANEAGLEIDQKYESFFTNRLEHQGLEKKFVVAAPNQPEKISKPDTLDKPLDQSKVKEAVVDSKNPDVITTLPSRTVAETPRGEVVEKIIHHELTDIENAIISERIKEQDAQGERLNRASPVPLNVAAKVRENISDSYVAESMTIAPERQQLLIDQVRAHNSLRGADIEQSQILAPELASVNQDLTQDHEEASITSSDSTITEIKALDTPNARDRSVSFTADAQIESPEDENAGTLPYFESPDAGAEWSGIQPPTGLYSSEVSEDYAQSNILDTTELETGETWEAKDPIPYDLVERVEFSWAHELAKDPVEIFQDFHKLLESFPVTDKEEGLSAITRSETTPEDNHIIETETNPMLRTFHELSDRMSQLTPNDVYEVGVVLQDIAGAVHGIGLLEARQADGELIAETNQQLLELCANLFETVGLEVTPEKIDNFVSLLGHTETAKALQGSSQTNALNLVSDLENDGTHEAKFSDNFRGGLLVGAKLHWAIGMFALFSLSLQANTTNSA